MKDYVTTVSAYLTDYKSQTDRRIQDEYSRKFTCYILSTCWRKIFKRITSWQVTAFICWLDFIPPSKLKSLYKNCHGPSHIKRGDKTLMDFLRRAQIKDNVDGMPAIQSLLLDYIKPSGLSDVQNLLSISCKISANFFRGKCYGISQSCHRRSQGLCVFCSRFKE